MLSNYISDSKPFALAIGIAYKCSYLNRNETKENASHYQFSTKKVYKLTCNNVISVTSICKVYTIEFVVLT